MSFGKRLAEERKRIGLNQTEFGKIGGVTKTSQVNYEAGERSPNVDYWQAIAASGADVQYILTGIRTTAVATQEPTLTARQKALLDNYEHTDEYGKGIIEATAFATAKPEQAKNALDKKASNDDFF